MPETSLRLPNKARLVYISIISLLFAVDDEEDRGVTRTITSGVDADTIDTRRRKKKAKRASDKTELDLDEFLHASRRFPYVNFLLPTVG